jgi:hypothetical protein
VKRIVDYILTISKLDSGLLVMALVDLLPESVAKRLAKIFEGEARATGADMRFVVEDSYCELGVDWIQPGCSKCSSRSLPTPSNSLGSSPTVSIGACAKQPERSSDGIKYILAKVADEDARLQDDWVST